jgi:hypothetical protein
MVEKAGGSVAVKVIVKPVSATPKKVKGKKAKKDTASTDGGDAQEPVKE